MNNSKKYWPKHLLHAGKLGHNDGSRNMVKASDPRSRVQRVQLTKAEKDI